MSGCRFFVPGLIVGSTIVTLLASWVVYKYGSRTSDGSVERDFLINVAAGLVEISIGTALTAALALLVAKSKFIHLSRPTLNLIQRLRIDGRLTREGARRSVVFAVALLSEGNVAKTLGKEVTRGTRSECPICAKRVREKMDRCSFCKLPRTIWSDEKLVVIHRNNPRTYRDD